MNIKISRFVAKCALASAASLGAVAFAQAADVGVAVNINAPGIYGQIVLGGGLPAPELILPQPVVAVPAPVVVGVVPEPLYLHVPPGHEKHWAKHCREYNACGRPVYFVSDRWYRDVYSHRHEHYDEGRHRGHHHDEDHDRGHGHGHDHGDDRD